MKLNNKHFSVPGATVFVDDKGGLSNNHWVIFHLDKDSAHLLELIKSAYTGNYKWNKELLPAGFKRCVAKNCLMVKQHKTPFTEFFAQPTKSVPYFIDEDYEDDYKVQYKSLCSLYTPVKINKTYWEAFGCPTELRGDARGCKTNRIMYADNYAITETL